MVNDNRRVRTSRRSRAPRTEPVGGPTLDQLRVLVAAAEAGSFSAAARVLGRVQSAVSQSMSNLEAELSLALWDRGARSPVLTRDGHAVLAAARRVGVEADALRQLAQSLRGGQEPMVALAVDAVFPVRVLEELGAGFAREFPAVQLRVQTEVLTAVSALVSSGACQLGVIGPHADARGLSREALMTVEMVPVVSSRHPFARRRGKIPSQEVTRAVQIVLSERGHEADRDRAVLGDRTWRISDLCTKRALILAGLGWGNLPDHLIAADLEAGRLVRIQPAPWSRGEYRLSLALAHRSDVPLGPAARWVRTALRAACAAGPGKQRRSAASARVTAGRR